MDSDEYSLEELFPEMPKENRFGFYTDSGLDLSPDFDAATRMLNRLSEAREIYIDDDGYEWRVLAQNIDEKMRRLAWAEWRFKQGRGEHEYHNYYLKRRDAAGKFSVWEIETYNPYFGCSAEYLGWAGDNLIFVYEDKHDTFVARMDPDGSVERIEIKPAWKIEGEILNYANGQQKLNLLTFETEE